MNVRCENTKWRIQSDDLKLTSPHTDLQCGVLREKTISKWWSQTDISPCWTSMWSTTRKDETKTRSWRKSIFEFQFPYSHAACNVSYMKNSIPQSPRQTDLNVSSAGLTPGRIVQDRVVWRRLHSTSNHLASSCPPSTCRHRALWSQV